MNLEKQRHIFNIFHDGFIVSISKQNSKIILKIEIQYLAKMLSKDFDYFYVELISCKNLKLITWDNKQTITNLEKIAKLEPEIINCDDKISDRLKIFCALSFRSGGELWIKTNEIKVFDQNRNSVTFETLRLICKKYWDNFDKINSNIE
jgi:hypothetical protein